MATVTEAGVALEAQKDHIMWLVQRYGYARRNLKHQGRTAAEWFRSINTALNVAELLALVSPGEELVVDANRVLPLVPDSRDGEIAGWKEWAAMAEARIEELEAALEPFAVLANVMIASRALRSSPDDRRLLAPITLGALRRARAVLNPEEESE
jgi:hypothetical protein